jgi:hypothetical protein
MFWSPTAAWLTAASIDVKPTWKAERPSCAWLSDVVDALVAS